MKCTNTTARVDRSGKHNDRKFNLDYAEHIDQERTKDNKYYRYNGDESLTFRELELEFYKIHFEDKINEQNEKNNQRRQSNRNKTVENYYHQKNTRPEDQILQIGDKNNHATGEELWECALAYKDRFDELFGDHCKIIDMALHMDEATPHVHVRRVWIAEDENGKEYVSENKALEQLGTLLSDGEKKQNKWNNRKVAFTHTDRTLFESICEERGFDIDRTRGAHREHLDTITFKAEKDSAKIEELERQIEEKQQALNDIEEKIEEKSEELDNLKLTETFLINNGLMDEFLLFAESEKKKEKQKVQKREERIISYF